MKKKFKLDQHVYCYSPHLDKCFDGTIVGLHYITDYNDKRHYRYQVRMNFFPFDCAREQELCEEEVFATLYQLVEYIVDKFIRIKSLDNLANKENKNE